MSPLWPRAALDRLHAAVPATSDVHHPWPRGPVRLRASSPRLIAGRRWGRRAATLQAPYRRPSRHCSLAICHAKNRREYAGGQVAMTGDEGQDGRRDHDLLGMRKGRKLSDWMRDADDSRGWPDQTQGAASFPVAGDPRTDRQGESSSVTPGPGVRVRKEYATPLSMLRDDTVGYQLGRNVTLEAAPGELLQAGAFRYVVAPATAVNAWNAAGDDTTTAGGLKLRALPTSEGSYAIDSFAAGGEGVTDDTGAFKAAIAHCPPYGKIIGRPGAIYRTTEILVKKPVNIDMQWAWWRPTFSHNGHLLAVEDTRTGISGLFQQHPNDPLLPGRRKQDNSGFILSNFFLEGNLRQQEVHGIIFRGGNSKTRLLRGYILNFKGSGISACDPDGATGADAANQYMQECIFEDVEIRNCGAPGRSAYVIGRNQAGGSNHNNLMHREFRIIYPRDSPALVITNKNTSRANGRIQRLYFDRLWVHGNRSLATRDGNGDETHAGADLVVINGDSYTQPCEEIYFANSRLMEQEHGCSALRVNGATDVSWQGEQLASGADRPGVTLNGAGNFRHSGQGLEYRAQVNIIAPLAEGKRVTVGDAINDQVLNHSGPNLLLSGGATLDHVLDLTEDLIRYNFMGDRSATAATAVTLAGATSDWVRILRGWFVPLAGLTSSDTDFAKIKIGTYGFDGTLQSSHSVSTRTRRNGGTGNWEARARVDLQIPTNFCVGSSISVSITKNGSGVLIPQGAFVFQASKALYV